MLIASDRHYTQGALDHTAITWDAATRRLTGQFTAVDSTPYAITVSVPDGYAAQGAADMVFTAQDVAVDAAVTDALSAVERWDAVTRTDGSVAGSVARAPVPAPAQQRAQQRASGSPSRASSRAAIAQQQAARVAAQREPEAVSYATTTRGPQP